MIQFPAGAFLLVLLLCSAAKGFAQDSTAIAIDTAQKAASKFDNFNKKAEALFKVLPVPLVSYSTEAGITFGLAKFNLFHVSKKDTISKPSKISGIVSYSTMGRINASVANDLIFDENKYMIISYINYKKTPEFIYGIGNDVKRADEEQISIDRLKFAASPMRRIIKNLYAGIALDVSNYFNIKVDSNSFLIKDNVPGLDGGASIGAGFSAAFDSRDNRYNPYKGEFILTDILFYEPWLGSRYRFIKSELDARKYFNPWLEHVIALQVTTTYTSGTIPFYELAKMGGEYKMRGYYEGAIRDKVLVDAQVEYRMPVWKIFGIAGWIGTGRVADYYGHLKPSGYWLSYGLGLRVKVDSRNNTNLRIDCGFGPHNVRGFYIDFGEAF